MPAAENVAQFVNRKNFTSAEKGEITRLFLARSNNGGIQHGAYQQTEQEFGWYWKTIKRLWQKYSQQQTLFIL